jgi:hypothetical protein
VRASRGEAVDHVVNVCVAGTLEQSLKAVLEEGTSRWSALSANSALPRQVIASSLASVQTVNTASAGRLRLSVTISVPIPAHP